MAIQIYGAKNCSSCNTAKDVCKANNIAYDYHELDSDYVMSDLMEMCEENNIPLPRKFPLILDNLFEPITLEELKQIKQLA